MAVQVREPNHQLFACHTPIPCWCIKCGLFLSKQKKPIHLRYREYLIPNLTEIYTAPYYWGSLDRYEAEKVLEGAPEGSFLLRDSSHREYMFSVSFTRFGACLHARIEHRDHRFSFDAHDPCVFSAASIPALLQYYKTPAHCMFFDSLLSNPLHRKFIFSLKDLCRAKISDNFKFDQINQLHLPHPLRQYLTFYRYIQAEKAS